MTKQEFKEFAHEIADYALDYKKEHSKVDMSAWDYNIMMSLTAYKDGKPNGTVKTDIIYLDMEVERADERVQEFIAVCENYSPPED